MLLLLLNSVKTRQSFWNTWSFFHPSFGYRNWSLSLSQVAFILCRTARYMVISLMFLVVAHVPRGWGSCFLFVDYKDIVCMLKIIAICRHEADILLPRPIPCRDNPIVYRTEAVICNECLISKVVPFCIKNICCCLRK